MISATDNRLDEESPDSDSARLRRRELAEPKVGPVDAVRAGDAGAGESEVLDPGSSAGADVAVEVALAAESDHAGSRSDDQVEAPGAGGPTIG